MAIYVRLSELIRVHKGPYHIHQRPFTVSLNHLLHKEEHDGVNVSYLRKCIDALCHFQV